ncbi:hypothetical protein F2Q70_00040895 [Brassica cretica]|uniref:Uncharacterized protein n=1 Tax=Brassica cretica TaxID=69181 RepID=A0A8S9K8P4_BRACR|nr:hypothetical protein F2Q70_00040895 [Brassica cretica]
MTFTRCLVFTRLEFKKARSGLRTVEKNAKIARASVEFVLKITVWAFRMLFGVKITGRDTVRLPCVQR